MGNITIQGDLTGDVPGGEVGGASNLTTVGAIPYVSAAGILNQDPTALFWDAANNRLGVGTNAPAFPLVVSDGSSTAEANAAGGAAFFQSGNAPLIIGSRNTGFELRFRTEGTEGMRLTAFTRNLLIGTTTDSNFKLDVAASGSAGTARFYGGSGVSASTKVVVQAGGGQSGNLQEWQNSAGAVLSYIAASGNIRSDVTADFGTDVYFRNGGSTQPSKVVISGPNQWIRSGQSVLISWDNASNALGGSVDIAIGRSSAGLLEINNGTAGTYRDLILRRSQHSGVTVADLPAAAAGNAGSIQYVTDANATTIGSTVAGGGANKVMVWSDGAAWKIFAS